MLKRKKPNSVVVVTENQGTSWLGSFTPPHASLTIKSAYNLLVKHWKGYRRLKQIPHTHTLIQEAYSISSCFQLFSSRSTRRQHERVSRRVKNCRRCGGNYLWNMNHRSLIFYKHAAVVINQTGAPHTRAHTLFCSAACRKSNSQLVLFVSPTRSFFPFLRYCIVI